MPLIVDTMLCLSRKIEGGGILEKIPAFTRFFFLSDLECSFKICTNNPTYLKIGGVGQMGSA